MGKQDSKINNLNSSSPNNDELKKLEEELKQLKQLTLRMQISFEKNINEIHDQMELLIIKLNELNIKKPDAPDKGDLPNFSML